VTPLPSVLGGAELVAWRLDQAIYATTWDSGEGAYRVGGRWNSAGVRVLYCAFDPATAILEVAVHKGFRALDTVPHVMTAATISDIAGVHIVTPDQIPNPNWLRPGIPSAGQQAFGDGLLREHSFVVVPSVVSTHSWNLLFTARAPGYSLKAQEPFALDASPPAVVALKLRSV